MTRMAATRTDFENQALVCLFLVGISPFYSFSFAPHFLQYLASGGSILVPQKGQYLIVISGLYIVVC